MLFLIKIFISAGLIAFASWLAGKNPHLAGFVVALPLTSVLTLFWAYWQYRDMEKINELAVSILAAVPLSLVFFLPFVLNRWLKLNFLGTMALGLACLFGAYLVHAAFFKGRG